MKIYLAGRFHKRDVLHEIGEHLKQHGHSIVSRWSKPNSTHIKPVGMSEQAADGARRRYAVEDRIDIHHCDWMVSLMDEPRSDGRGGRHVEFGIALATGKKLTIIGPRETVFHHLAEVEQFDTKEKFYKSIKRG